MVLLTLIITLLILYVFASMIVICRTISEEGPIIPEKLVDEYLDKVKDQCKYVNHGYFIKLTCGGYNPSIYKSSPVFFTFLIPYYIDGVGVIPVWYKSAREIKKLMGETKESKENKIKEKLGL
jgi:hypothetical protein